MKTYKVEADGSLTITEDNGGAKNADGSPKLCVWSIQASQVNAHRRDPAIDAGVRQAASAAQLTAFDAAAPVTPAPPVS